MSRRAIDVLRDAYYTAQTTVLRRCLRAPWGHVQHQGEAQGVRNNRKVNAAEPLVFAAAKTTEEEHANVPVRARKRLNVEFPQRVADQLDSYAEATGRSKTEFLRLAIGTYAVLCDEMLNGNRIFVASQDGRKLLRELVLPT
jgi:hypothetical protein